MMLQEALCLQDADVASNAKNRPPLSKRVKSVATLIKLALCRELPIGLPLGKACSGFCFEAVAGMLATATANPIDKY